MFHIPPHLHLPFSLCPTVSPSTLLLTPLLFILVFSPFSPRTHLAPLLATIALSSHECQHPCDSMDQLVSEECVLCISCPYLLFFSTLFILYIQKKHIPLLLLLFSLTVLFCWLVLFSVCLCSKITVAGQDCSDCKKKERDHHKEGKTEWG